MRSGRQIAILAFLEAWQATHAYPPSVREIGEATATSSQSVVVYNLRKLRDAGLVTFVDGESRTVTLTGTRYTWPANEEVAS